MKPDFEISVASENESDKGEGFRLGDYLLLIKSTILKTTKRGRCVLLRFHILESRPIEGAEQEPNAMGTNCSVVINFEGEKARSATFRLKLFVCGLFGVPLGSLSEAAFNETATELLREKDGGAGVLEANPARGMLVRLCVCPDPRYGIKFVWGCVAPPGEDQNTLLEARKRIQALALSGDLTSESQTEKCVFLALLSRGRLDWRDGCVCIYGDAWEIIPQYEELVYRIDFALFASDLKIAFEVDGFEYHDRTLEQAQNDRKRDRDLQAAGWLIPRFTTLELQENIDHCLSELFALVKARDERRV